jgi:hypothetical protein
MTFCLDTLASHKDTFDEASLVLLRSLGSKEHQAGVWALNLLERVTGERFEEEFDPIPDDIETAAVDFSRTGEVVPHVLQVFPNPAGDIVYVMGTFDSDQTGYVELMGMQGERLASQMLRAGEMIYFDLTKFPNGVYTVRLEGIDQRDAVRFVHHQ